MSGYNYFAANNQFRSQHLRMRGGFMPPPPLGGGNFTSVTNVNIKNGTGNDFLDFALGFMHGVRGSDSCCQHNYGSTFNWGFGGWQPVFPQIGTTNTTSTQTANTTQNGGIDKAGNLQKMYSKYQVIDNGNGTYTITSGKGDNIKTGSYEELMKGLDKTPEGDNPKVDPEKDPEKAPEKDPEKASEKAPEKAPGTVDDGSDKVDGSGKDVKVAKSGNGNKESANTPKGDILHKAANGDLMTKDSSTSPAQYHYYKYNSETGKYTETNETEFRAAHNQGNNAINLTALKEGGNTTTSLQQGKRVKGQNGRYAEQDKNGKWHYYSHDGKELKSDYVLNQNSQGYDPTLAAKTQTQPKQKSTQEQIANATATVVQNKY